MFTTAMEYFATVKLKSRNIASLGSPRLRLVLSGAKRFSMAKVKACRDEKKDYGKSTLGFAMAKKQTSIFEPTISPFSKAYK